VDTIDRHELAARLLPVVHRAGAAIMGHYRAGVTARYKDNASPVTVADEEAEAILLAGLGDILPRVPVVAEEAVSAGRIPVVGDRFLLVDPLDGTREFVNRRDEFTVNVALIEHGVPVFGVVYAPALSELFLTTEPARAIEARLDPDAPCPTLDALGGQRLATRAPDMTRLTVVASRSHLDAETQAFIGRFKVAERTSAGSSLKFGLIARGTADLYPRFGPTMEWDTAAGHAVLAAAGGVVTCTDGAPFTYGKTAAGFRNPGFVAWGRASTST
jgi:3'(2'), 5'-bisphosphate nucleotidase